MAKLIGEVQWEAVTFDSFAVVAESAIRRDKPVDWVEVV